MKLTLSIFLALIVTLSLHAQSTESAATVSSPAKWTVMVYMNGKNDLENAIKTNWDQMSSVPTSPEINVLTEIGRLGADGAFGGWRGVKRFKVKQGEEATAENALVDLGSNGLNTDMGSPDTLRDFLNWGITTYPAEHYMLIIWNHGQGWRDAFARATARLDYLNLKAKEFSVLKKGNKPQLALKLTEFPLDEIPAAVQADVAISSGIRSVSTDEQTHHVLYNADVAKVVEDVFGSNKLDVLGFDACLMAMIETAHTFRHGARYLVASEETVAHEGWDYKKFLSPLLSSPSMSPKDVAVQAVSAYQAYYAPIGGSVATMSASDLSHVDALVSALDALTLSLQDQAGVAAARAARAPLNSYLTWLGGSAQEIHSSVDLGAWVSNIASQKSASMAAKKNAAAVSYALSTTILSNFASPSRNNQAGFGSNGLAIFFPQTTADFLADPDSAGYVVDNTFKPVPFVRETRWATFLATAFGLPTQSHLTPAQLQN